ncbi:MAG: hypothetical protein GY719_31470 [bacterium]|nr:hypothetical protein [bacterium]
MNDEHLKILQQGVVTWNEWRAANAEVRPDLAHVDFTGANLADIRGAVVGATSLIACDLAGIRNLATVDHSGPSDISTSTLAFTAAALADQPHRQGEIEAFLHGAGVEEDWIDVFRCRIGQSIEF